MATPIQYTPQYIPTNVDMMSNVLDRRQADYNAGYAAPLGFEDQFSQIEVSPENLAGKQAVLGNFQDKIKGIVDQYGGDYGAASRDIARAISKERQNKFYQLAPQMTKAAEEARMIKQKLGPNALVKKDIPRQFLDDKGNITSTDASYDIQDVRYIDSIIKGLAKEKSTEHSKDINRTRSGGYREIGRQEGFESQSEAANWLDNTSEGEEFMSGIYKQLGSDPGQYDLLDSRARDLALSNLVGDRKTNLVQDRDYTSSKNQEQPGQAFTHGYTEALTKKTKKSELYGFDDDGKLSSPKMTSKDDLNIGGFESIKVSGGVTAESLNEAAIADYTAQQEAITNMRQNYPSISETATDKEVYESYNNAAKDYNTKPLEVIRIRNNELRDAQDKFYKDTFFDRRIWIIDGDGNTVEGNRSSVKEELGFSRKSKGDADLVTAKDNSTFLGYTQEGPVAGAALYSITDSDGGTRRIAVAPDNEIQSITGLSHKIQNAKNTLEPQIITHGSIAYNIVPDIYNDMFKFDINVGSLDPDSGEFIPTINPKTGQPYKTSSSQIKRIEETGISNFLATKK